MFCRGVAIIIWCYQQSEVLVYSHSILPLRLSSHKKVSNHQCNSTQDEHSEKQNKTIVITLETKVLNRESKH